MDPAQAYMLAATRNQGAMNAVIGRFDSPVQQFYSDATLFITGGSGFLGKQLIEKLFRSCRIKKVYLLIRGKKGKSIQERLDKILKEPVYDVLHENQPDFGAKIVPIEGDSMMKLLGMSEQDRKTIIKEVDVIFHMAATTRFDEPIRVATLVNVRGTMEVIALAKECGKLKSLVYVSTAYSHATDVRTNKELLEQFYPSPVPPSALVQMAEVMEEDRLNSITPSLIKNWPNTYTFTKAVAEEAVRVMAADLPICIVRPSIVLCCYREPTPGWLDMSTVFGPSGLVLGAVLGVVHVFKTESSKKISVVPVDLVNNASIAAGWDSTQKKQEEQQQKIPIYNMASIDSCITWEYLHNVLNGARFKLPSQKAIWYCYFIVTPYSSVFWLLSWMLHLIPAYLIDAFDYVLEFKPKNIPPMVSIYKKINKFAQVFDYFLSNQWNFRDTNTSTMMSRMTDADKAIYNCDLSSVDRKTLIEIWGLGVRKYMVKDGLRNTVKGTRKQMIFKYVNFVAITVYLFVLGIIFYSLMKLFLSFMF